MRQKPEFLAEFRCSGPLGATLGSQKRPSNSNGVASVAGFELQLRTRCNLVEVDALLTISQGRRAANPGLYDGTALPFAGGGYAAVLSPTAP